MDRNAPGITVALLCTIVFLCFTTVALAGTIDGTIVDSEIDPVANISVDLYDALTDECIGCDTTDEFGYFSITSGSILANSDFYFILRPPSSTDYIMKRVSVSTPEGSPDATQNSDISSGKSTISGTAFRASLGTNISFWNYGESIGSSSSTDASGAYVLDNLMAGAARIEAQPDIDTGYAYASIYLDVPADDNETDINLHLRKGAKISGTVSGAGAGLEVYLDGPNGTAWTETDASGYYEMRIPPGVYVLNIECPSPGESGLVATTQVVTVTDFLDDQDIDITSFDTSGAENVATITGTVSNVPDGAIAIVVAFKKDILKNLSPYNTENMTALAMAPVVAGAYSLSVPPDSDVDISAIIYSEANGISSQTLWGGAILGVNVPAAGETIPGQNFAHDDVDGGTISGVVIWNSDTVAMAEVLLYDDNKVFCGSADTGTGGAYEFEHVPAGTYTLMAKISYSNGLMTGWRQVTVSEAGSVEAADLYITPAQNATLFNPADISSNGARDLVLEYAGTGLYAFDDIGNTQSFSLISTLGPTMLASPDLNGDGARDLVLDYGEGAGLYAYDFSNGKAFTKITSLSPTLSTVTDLNGDGAVDLVLDYGEGTGFYAYDYASGQSFTKITNLAPILLTATDLNGDGAGELLFDYGEGVGIYAYNFAAGGSFTKITGFTPTLLASTDIDDDGYQELIFDYGSGVGLYVFDFEDDMSFTPITSLTPTLLAATDLDGDGSRDLVLDYGDGTGIYAYNFSNSQAFTKISGLTPDLVACADVDGDNDQDLIFDYGAGTGLYAYEYDIVSGGTFTRITSLSPTVLAATDLNGDSAKDLVLDYGEGTGIYAYDFMDETPFTKISGLTPTLLAASDLNGDTLVDLLLDYGAGTGEYIYQHSNGQSFTKMTSLAPTLPAGDADVVARVNFQASLNPSSNTGLYTMRGDLVYQPVGEGAM